MVLPNLSESRDTVSVISAFRGLNRNLQTIEGEFSDFKNITNDYYPLLGNRKRRGIVEEHTNVQGVLGGQLLAIVDDNKFYYDGSLIAELEETDEERQIIRMGALLVVMPDGLIYNTYDFSVDHTDVSNTSAGNPTLTLCKLDGTTFNSRNTVTSDEEPEDRTKYWIDTSSDPVVIKMYSTSETMWSSVGTTYVKIEATGIGAGLREYDAATLSGVDTAQENPAVYNNWDFNTSNIIYDAGDNYIVVAGLINKVFTNSKPITVERKHPKMDFVCELDNRLWGCSTDNHEIYACKLGDPKNWYCYAGLDSDSYAATVGSQGSFTGCVTYAGNVFFFKEEGYHRIYGTKPSTFEVSWKAGRGVQYGSHKSICIVNDRLYFKSRDQISVYDGTIENISLPLGNRQYYEAVGGCYRNKYYLSMRDSEYEWKMFVYDSIKGMWTIEDDFHALCMAYVQEGLMLFDIDSKQYAVTDEDLMRKWFPKSDRYPHILLYPNKIADGESEERFDWRFTTGDIGMEIPQSSKKSISPYHKYFKRLDVRFSLAKDAYMKIYVSFDSTDDFHKFAEFRATKKRTYSVPIPLNRCDHMKLMFTGAGDFRLYSIARVTEEGSDGFV